MTPDQPMCLHCLVRPAAPEDVLCAVCVTGGDRHRPVETIQLPEEDMT